MDPALISSDYTVSYPKGNPPQWLPTLVLDDGEKDLHRASRHGDSSRATGGVWREWGAPELSRERQPGGRRQAGEEDPVETARCDRRDQEKRSLK